MYVLLLQSLQDSELSAIFIVYCMGGYSLQVSFKLLLKIIEMPPPSLPSSLPSLPPSLPPFPSFLPSLPFLPPSLPPSLPFLPPSLPPSLLPSSLPALPLPQLTQSSARWLRWERPLLQVLLSVCGRTSPSFPFTTPPPTSPPSDPKVGSHDRKVPEGIGFKVAP